MSPKQTQKLTIAAVCLALCMLLPLLTAQIPTIGSMLSPMHIPVYICAFLAGPLYGGLVGAIAPLLRNLIFGMPPLYPVAIAMAFELCAYGIVAGLIYKLSKKHMELTQNVYITLIIAMILGRIVFGAAMYVLLMLKSQSYTFDAFINATVLSGIPGIVLHILIVPPVVLATERSGILK
ncbi:MAG: ECF transporter S component [Christensenellaceae bacterium]|nr:ECF transporter S component [Christensenellaceae bacterium]